MNVDLDIVARVPLDGLVEAMGDRVFVLHIGSTGRKYQAHVELASSLMGMPADRTIMGLVSIVKKLPRRYRRIWDSANSRDFNVGIEAGLEPHTFELRLDRRTIDAIVEVHGDVVVTVYAPDVNRSSVPLPRKRAAARKKPRR
jgi:hypothetical protein